MWRMCCQPFRGYVWILLSIKMNCNMGFFLEGWVLGKGELDVWHLQMPHDDVIKWKHFPRYWSCVRGIHRSPVNSPHKGLWRGALMFSLICVGINGWINHREAGDLRSYCAHYDVSVMRLPNGGQMRRLQIDGLYKTAVTLLLTHWSYCSFALSHR